MLNGGWAEEPVRGIRSFGALPAIQDTDSLLAPTSQYRVFLCPTAPLHDTRARLLGSAVAKEGWHGPLSSSQTAVAIPREDSPLPPVL
jgi:hypothetical protein